MAEADNKKDNQDSGKGTARSKGLTTTHIILIIGFLILIAAVGIGVYFILNQEEPPPPQDTNFMIVDETNAQGILGSLQEQVGEGMFQTYMTTEWSFPAGSATSTDAVIGNSRSNTYPLYVEIIRADTDEVLFKSGAMEPGTMLKELTLNQVLPNGSYGLICQFHILSEDKQSERSVVSIRATGIVGS